MEDVVKVCLNEKQTKELFEKQFGVDNITRTRKQWKNLIKNYGYQIVMETEKMTKSEVKAKCKN